MELIELNGSNALIETAAGWLGDKRNYQWLDFGNGVQRLNAVSLKIMAQKDIHVLRIFTADDADVPIGIVGLSNVDRNFKTATLWAVLGDKRYARQNYTLRSLAGILTLGFEEVGLQAITAWAVETNTASMHIVRDLHFRPMGRQRQCHYIEGRPYDRLWFDLLASEHRELNHA